MNETRLLNELTVEIQRFCIFQNNEVQTAYETIRNDERFERWITLSKVQKIFTQLQKGLQPTIDLPLYIFKFLNEIKPLGFQLHKTTLFCDHEIQSCLQLSHGFSMDGRFVLYNTMSNSSYNNYGFLLYDTFNNKSRYITAQKRQNATFNGFVFLRENLGLLFETTENAAFSSLMKLDWDGKKMRTVQMSDILPSNTSNVMIDALNPTQIAFVSNILARQVRVRLCEIKNDEIVQLRVIIVGFLSYPRANSIFDGKLYSFGCSNHYGEQFPNIYVSNLEQNVPPSIFALEWSSNEFSVLKPLIYCWVHDRFYVVVKFEEIEKLGIAWTNCSTLDWTLIKFITSERIIQIQFAANILLVQTVSTASTSRFEDVHQIQHTFHRIPIKNPDLLSSLAWSVLVQSKSKLPNIMSLSSFDPYEEARQYLPFTSEIQYPFDK